MQILLMQIFLNMIIMPLKDKIQRFLNPRIICLKSTITQKGLDVWIIAVVVILSVVTVYGKTSKPFSSL